MLNFSKARYHLWEKFKSRPKSHSLVFTAPSRTNEWMMEMSLAD